MQLIFFLSLLIMHFQTQADIERHNELNIVKTIGKGMFFYPAGPMPMFSYGSFTVLEDRKLLIFDSAGTHPFYIIDVDEEKVTSFGTWGRGPGEFLKDSPKMISVTEGSIYIYDHFSSYLHRFGLDQSFHETILIDVLTPSLSSVHIYNDNTLIYSAYTLNNPEMENEYFFNTHSIQNSQISEQYKGLLKLNSITALKPAKYNGVLKYGPVQVHDSIIYLANLFGSIILGLNSEGEIVFQTDDPEQGLIPETNPRFLNGILIGEPEETTFRNFDLAVDEDYIYTLYSGASLRFEETSAFMTGGKIDDDELRIGEAKSMRLYDRNDSSYLGEYTLPEYVSAIAVDKDYLYGVVWDDEPHIIVLEKPQL